eukprot:1255794-Rhodomonas_salina.1
MSTPLRLERPQITCGARRSSILGILRTRRKRPILVQQLVFFDHQVIWDRLLRALRFHCTSEHASIYVR